MNLANILNENRIIVDLTATNRWEAINELIRKLVECGEIKPEHARTIEDAVKKREMQMSTGVGNEVGLPHASVDMITEAVGAMGRSSKGVDFDALDNQMVRFVVLVLVPKGQFQKHLHTLANISKLMHKKEFRQGLSDAPSANDMYRIIQENSAAL